MLLIQHLAAFLALVLLPAPPPQTDLDALMKKAVARRDHNWKTLQQYVLEERDTIDVRGSMNLRLWHERREFLWYPRDGFFVRSPLSVNGVKVSESDRRAEEDGYLRWVQARDQSGPDKPDGRSAITIGPQGIRFMPASTSTPENDPPAAVGDLIRQRRQPEFIEAAYLLRLSFDEGRYAFVGRERVEDIDTLRIEYYPARLYKPDEKAKERESNAIWTHVLNKAALITVWVEPKSAQIVRYTFDNISLDFFPAAWLMRPRAFAASMTMSQAFKGVWLPKDVEIKVGAMLATGPIDVSYRMEYRDYKEASTDARIKRD